MSQSLQVNKSFGGLTVQGQNVIKTPGSSLNNVAAMTTVGANTGTSAAGLSLIGNTTSVDQSTNLMRDLKSLQEDVNSLQTSVNLILASLRSFGVIQNLA